MVPSRDCKNGLSREAQPWACSDNFRTPFCQISNLLGDMLEKLDGSEVLEIRTVMRHFANHGYSALFNRINFRIRGIHVTQGPSVKYF